MTDVLRTGTGCFDFTPEKSRSCRYPFRELLMKNIGLLVLCGLCLLKAAPAQIVGDASVATRLLALEHAWNQAEERKDARAMDSILDNSMVYIDYDGSMLSKAQFLAQIKAPSLQPQQEITQSMSVHVYSNTAVVSGVYIAKGIENGKAYTRHGRFLDTWTIKDGNWVCIASQATPILH